MSATLSSPTTARPSKIRSTAIDDSTAENRAPARREAAMVRTTSPARKGSRLLAMKPIATACQSGRAGSALPSVSRSRSRQRMSRIT